MRNLTGLMLAAGVLLTAGYAIADDDLDVTARDTKHETTRDPASDVQTSETETMVTERKSEIGVTNFALRPSAGAIFFNGNQRFAGGILADFNLLSTSFMKVGPATGAIYSSLDGGNFFSAIPQTGSNYIIQIPANIKVTIAPDPGRRLQLGVHGGADVIYSASGATAGAGRTGFGRAPGPVPVTGSSWDAYGNVGGDIDYALGTNVDLSLRPDVAFLDSFAMITTTLGLALKM